MTVTLELSEEVHARLRSEAERRNLTLDQLISDFVLNLPKVNNMDLRSRLSFVGIGDSGRTDLGRRHRELRKEQTKELGARDF